LYEKQLAIERIRAARSAIDASKTGVVLTGVAKRGWSVIAIRCTPRSTDSLAYAQAGADCLTGRGRQ